jgi:hypothetical protein
MSMQTKLCFYKGDESIWYSNVSWWRLIYRSQSEGTASFPDFRSCAGKSLQVGVGHLTKNQLLKGSFSLITKPNSHARCENFHPITIFERTRCKISSWLLLWVRKNLQERGKYQIKCSHLITSHLNNKERKKKLINRILR